MAVLIVYIRLPNLPGKFGILSFTFPDLEKKWNFNTKPGFCF